jgi:hypothetical protein
VPSLDLQFADTKSLTDAISGQNLITFTRASSATYVGSDGLIKTAATNESRFDHDPTTGESLGLLVEEQRTNLLLHNRDLTQAAWAASNITPLKDQVGADDVASSASKITATAANGTILQTVTSASAARSTTAYVKRITGTGTVEMTQDNGTTWAAVTVASAWTRVSIASATVANPAVGFRLATSGDAIAVDYVQCESGAFATSAIATTTATVTRSADVVSISGGNFSSWYRQTEGTVFADVSIPAVSLTALSFSDGTANERILMDTGTNTKRLIVTDGGSAQASVTRPYTYGTRAKTAVAAIENSFMLCEAGVLGTEDTAGTMPTVDRLNIGANATGSAILNSRLSRLTYWPQRLSNSTLQTLTQ